MSARRESEAFEIALAKWRALTPTQRENFEDVIVAINPSRMPQANVALALLRAAAEPEAKAGLSKCGWPGCEELSDPRWVAQVANHIVPACDGHGGLCRS